MRRSLLTLSALIACMAAGPLACKKTEDVVVTPGEDGEQAADEPEVEWPDEAFRAQRPEPREIAPVKIPSIETFELDNGLEVYLVEQQTLPTVMMLFEFDIGEVDDPKGKTGMAGVCAELMGEATKSKDKAAFAIAKDDHAVSLWARGGSERSTIWVRSIERELPAALDLTAEMMLEPGLRSEDFERIKNQHEDRLQQMEGSVTAIAYRLYPSLIWGANHPEGKIETAASIDAVTLEDCKKWVAKLRPDGARLWIAGKVTEAEVREQLGERLAKWKGKAPKLGKMPAPAPKPGTIYFVHVDGAAQSQILLGHLGPARKAEDYEATQIMSAILGGSFSSRINMNLREDKGWSYGARGGYHYSREGSYFSAGSSVRSDATAGALREIAKEIERMRTTDPTAEEVKREREGALLAMPADFATASSVLFEFIGLTYYDLPLDWHEGYQERLRTLDAKAVRAAAEAHLQSSGQVVLVVGDANVVLEEVEALAKEQLFGEGGIVYLDAEGKPTKRPKLTPKADEPRDIVVPDEPH
ncbi:insulinase family protein [Pseudenhygromyxa sp. WMMC2535]|uniref:M16 family metallopeptidase n=1 Tax=Pseudenhygromyxa sp. WMMC2535 TaxID=2712867 RepID=UPI001557372D|nr:pitrilysin family protein [Pseudenhygromyxa sp. WMMC2535]NVB38148.1 insulinase family protein [Pseudenhygromyxa sp. WMMC2535]